MIKMLGGAPTSYAPEPTVLFLLADSLGQIGLRAGFEKGGSAMPGVSRFTIDQTATPGTSHLRFYASDRSLSWQAPGDTEGPRVVVKYPQPIRLMSGNGRTWFLVTPIPGIFPTVDTDAAVNVAYQSSTFYGNVPVVGAAQNNLEVMLRALSQNSLTIRNHSVGGLTCAGLLAEARGLVADPSKATMLSGVTRILVQIGTNDLIGNGNLGLGNPDDPTGWMASLREALLILRGIAPVTFISPPCPGLSTAAKQLNAWKYFHRPLRSVCDEVGAQLLYPYEESYGATAATPDSGMVPDSAHSSSQQLWRAVPRILAAISPARQQVYTALASDLYDAVTNPIGNLLGEKTPTGTGGTAGTGGVATALYPGHVAECVTGTATITATQETLGGLTTPWQKLTMSGAGAITDICRCYKDYVFTPPAVDSVLSGTLEMYVPAQVGLRRLGVRFEILGGSGRIGVWEPETVTAQYPAIPNREYKLVVPVEGLKVPSGMTGVRLAVYLQTEIGATCSAYFKDRTLCPVAA